MITGYFIELIDYGRGNVIFSAAIPEVSREKFVAFWSVVGDQIYEGIIKKDLDRQSQFQVRVTPIITIT